MNPTATFERDLERWLEAEAPTNGPAGLHEAIIERAATMRQRPRWLAILRDSTFPSPAGVVRRPAGRMTYAFIVLGLILALIVAVLVAGALRSQPYRAPHWTAIVPKLTQLKGPTVTLLRDGRVLVFGGSPSSATPGYEVPGWAEILDPITGTSSATGFMVTPPRSNNTTTLLADGRVLVAGGGREVPAANGSGDSTWVDLASAELYDPVSRTWTATGSMVTPHGGGTGALHGTATLLRDGRVLVVSDDGAELYDPASGTWTATGDMVTPGRWGRTATLLRDGRVLVVGGYGGNAVGTLSSAELYDPAHGTWTATGSMARPRVGHTATLLSDGRVLVVGVDGGSAAALPLISAELYDPGTGSWTATGSMVTPRYSGHRHAAAR
jgi:hypothetical protein